MTMRVLYTNFSKRKNFVMRKIRTMESYIHDETLKDLIAVYLYTARRINDEESILEVNLSTPDSTGVRTITYKFIEDREAELIVHA